MIVIKNEEQLARMRVSGRMAASVRDALAAKIAPGVTTSELDAYGKELIAKQGARSAFYRYRGFPGYVCLSVNDEIVHGVPGNRRIAIGDIVSLDVGVTYDGYIGDTATTVMVGVTDAAVMRLVNATRRALDAAVSQARAGNRLGDISHSVEQVVTEAGFSIVREFVGHGVGRDLHEDPQIPNYGARGRGPKLKPGMTLAVEPIVSMDDEEWDLMDDGWTVRTRDRKPAAHFEHTLAIREGEAEILTLSEN